MSDLRERIQRVSDQIANAAVRSGREPSTVTLIAVSKTRPAEEVAEAVSCGIEHVGENRIQEAAEKAPRVREILGRDPLWHYIGTLQRNKARQALQLFGTIHSVDSVRLAEALAARTDAGKVPVLLEVYLGDDDARPGFRAAQLEEAATSISALSGIDLRGLMTVAPLGLDDEGTRRVFRQLRELRDQLRDHHPGLTLDQLSMGMTNDFAIAIEEGSTMVRVGRAIFGERN